jgi:HD-GYP domain-containing protein (c-di-GMP phosphodiesterase class II)
MLFRYGGDEFVVLTKDIDEDSLRDLARDIELDFSGKFISGVSMTLSHGVSVRDANAENIEKIIDKAEKDLYRFKSVHMNSTKFTTLKMLLGFLTRKFDYEKRHSEFVGIMTEKVGKQLSLSEFDINELAIAGMFHDIGKLTIPDQILNKPGKLTNEEFDVIKQHPVVGHRIIKDALPYSNISEYIFHHHERYDGKGYPTGLKGNDIPLQSRILCIVDAYEAMTSERVYKKRMSKNEAIVELKRCMGTQFDPQITKVFIDIISKEKEDD